MVARYKNIRWLRNTEINLDGVHFSGGCMWFPDRDGLNQMYEKKIADFSQIKDLGHWVYPTNKEFTDRAQDLVNKDTIVVSHHLPHARSTPEVFRGDQLNRFFVSDQTKLIEENSRGYGCTGIHTWRAITHWAILELFAIHTDIRTNEMVDCIRRWFWRFPDASRQE